MIADININFFYLFISKSVNIIKKKYFIKTKFHEVTFELCQMLFYFLLHKSFLAEFFIENDKRSFIF